MVSSASTSGGGERTSDYVEGGRTGSVTGFRSDMWKVITSNG